MDYVAFGFYAEHCVGCDMRNPTGRLPNLETEALTRQKEAEAEKARWAEKLRVRGLARAGRVERRRSLRASADPASVGTWTASMLSIRNRRLTSTPTRRPRRGAG